MKPIKLLLLLTILVTSCTKSEKIPSDIQANKVVPSHLQIDYQKMEVIGFIHFTTNTFTGKEWGFGDENPEIFNPTKLNAEQWVLAAKAGGIKELILTAKHHDGFAMYHSKVSKFNIVDATPFKRDVIEELYESCKKNGIRFGLYYSHARDWADDGDSQYSAILEMNRQQENVRSKGNRLESPWGANTWDPKPVSYDDYLKNKALPQVKELLSKFPALR